MKSELRHCQLTCFPFSYVSNSEFSELKFLKQSQQKHSLLKNVLKSFLFLSWSFWILLYKSLTVWLVDSCNSKVTVWPSDRRETNGETDIWPTGFSFVCLQKTFLSTREVKFGKIFLSVWPCHVWMSLQAEYLCREKSSDLNIFHATCTPQVFWNFILLFNAPKQCNWDRTM